MSKRILVTGAGGFIGGHVVKRLLDQGHTVRACDIKPLNRWYQLFEQAENIVGDCELKEVCEEITKDIDEVISLAFLMGGMEMICNNQANCILSSLINLQTITASVKNGVKKFFNASSACSYPTNLQDKNEIVYLKESDAWPALPEVGYGMAKLFDEEVCRLVMKDMGLSTYVARFYNVYGECYDDQTEILTREGFKFFKDVSFEDEIATLNIENKKIEYHQPNDIQKLEYNGEMYLIQARSQDLCITPNHSLVYQTDAKDDLRLSEIQSLDSRNRFYLYRSCEDYESMDFEYVKIPSGYRSDGYKIAKNNDEKNIPINDWLEFMGWFLSEGSTYIDGGNYCVNITQKIGTKLDQIKKCVTRIGFSYYEKPDSKGCIGVQISSKQLYEFLRGFGKSHQKYIPSELLNLPKERLRILYDTIMCGDGDADGGAYRTISKQLADNVQEMCLKLGYGASVSSSIYFYDDPPIPRTCWTVNITNKVVNLIEKHRNITKIPYNGFVYDVTVPNHTVFVRRNGKTCWSGNCGTWDGGKEKAPAALCRKVAKAKLSGNLQIDIGGDGTQLRNFTYISDTVTGILKLMDSNHHMPINLGSSEVVTINQLVTMIEEIAGIQLKRNYLPNFPTGVHSRNTDNTLIKSVLGWEPSVPLREGLEKTYKWIEGEIKAGRSGE